MIESHVMQEMQVIQVMQVIKVRHGMKVLLKMQGSRVSAETSRRMHGDCLTRQKEFTSNCRNRRPRATPN